MRIRGPEGETALHDNDPRQPQAFADFQRALESLIDEGLTAEHIRLVREISPALLRHR